MSTSSSLALDVEESGRGEPLLLMPGFSEGIPDLGEIHPELAKDYRVIAVALPGSGRSTPIPALTRRAFTRTTRRPWPTSWMFEESGLH